jgi:hypothetical protein
VCVEPATGLFRGMSYAVDSGCLYNVGMPLAPLKPIYRDPPKPRRHKTPTKPQRRLATAIDTLEIGKWALLRSYKSEDSARATAWQLIRRYPVEATARGKAVYVRRLK